MQIFQPSQRNSINLEGENPSLKLELLFPKRLRSIVKFKI
jgi:hypothetical protein